MSVTKQQILDALASVQLTAGSSSDPQDIVSLGMVSDPFITQNDGGAKVMFSLTVPADKAESLEPLRAEAEAAVTAVDGVVSAMVVLTAERKAGEASAAAPPPPPSPQPRPSPQRAAPPPQGTAPGGEKLGVTGVKHIIAVASGKGGVGKSTTAINLALGLQNQGLKVGVMDADIYGPSLPRLVGIDSKPEAEGRVLKPIEAYGLKVMSIGFLIAEDTPMIWRGPMVISALTQLLREVDWAPLDVLVVDMPPGTGDAQLTMAQQVPLAGSVIVSTPQDLSLIDARKGLNMFNKVSVPILGIVENMSTFICPSCGERSDIFGHGGAEAEAAKLGVPFLGGVPLHMDIRANSDAGTPVVASDPDGPHAMIYNKIAAQVADALNAEQASGPAIVFE
ncbi:MAG: Mrp/NBP35 family ATP-binding protein [Rhizobiaceae bacterium]|nr:Mrp/NBP35 family ATP-binding protein [Hyphomicrobiales bacterium]NRB31082.1 Mrp/NBP35 family ATP-binding protein [Rhizobiaceae bacterium]